jgi:hypothetical protein
MAPKTRGCSTKRRLMDELGKAQDWAIELIKRQKLLLQHEDCDLVGAAEGPIKEAHEKRKQAYIGLCDHIAQHGC